MEKIAPNLSAVVGTGPAANMMGAAGGLVALSRMPACNVQVLGAKKKALSGMSAAVAARSGDLHAGYVFAAEIVQQTPPGYRQKACKVVAAKCTLMARMDAYGEDPAGETGKRMREEIKAKIEKLQEPPPAKTIKPLPAPDQEVKKKRGGKRHRLMKERYGMTEMRKQANRINFNVPEEEIGLSGEGMGMIGQGGSGRVRVAAGNTKKLQKDAQKARRRAPCRTRSPRSRSRRDASRLLATNTRSPPPLPAPISLEPRRCFRRNTGTAAP